MSHDAETKPVASINFANVPEGTQPYLFAAHKPGRELLYEKKYHGDRDEEWILQIEDGVEVARHNVRYLESVWWEVVER